MDSEEVACAFVSQYYKILDQCPHNAHKFYGESSLLTWPEPDGGLMKPVTTLNGINEKILSSDYKDYTVVIYTIDSQASHSGGVIAAVTGVFLDDKDQVIKNFFQTFFLAKQKRGFFVLNDILQVSDPHETVNNVTSAVDSNVGANVSDNPAPSQTKAADEIKKINVESDVSVVSEGTVEKDPLLELTLNTNATEVSVPAPISAVSSVVDPTTNPDATVVAEPAASAGLTRDIRPALKVEVAPVSVPVASATPAPNASQKVSYASMAAKLQQMTSPRAAPISPKASSPRANGVQKAFVSSSSVSKPLATMDTARARSEVRGVYVGNLPYDITKHGVADALKKFGHVRRYSDSIQIRKFQDGFCCAFVEFESGDSARRAVEAHHVKIGENESYIAFKRTSNNRGGSGSPTRDGYKNGNGSRFDYDKGDQAKGSQRSMSSGWGAR